MRPDLLRDEPVLSARPGANATEPRAHRGGPGTRPRLGSPRSLCAAGIACFGQILNDWLLLVLSFPLQRWDAELKT